MTKRTRYFMLGSTLIVALGVGTGLVANGGLPLMRSSAGPAELSYVPADATGLAFANVREIMNSEFRQKLRTLLPTGEGKDEFLRETGIDIEHDIDSVLAASLTGSDSMHGLILIRGRFDEGRIEQLIREHQGVVTDYKGRRLLKPGAANGEASGPCLVFLETGLAAVGDEAGVKQAIDVAASHQDVTKNAELMKYVTQLEGAGNTAWAVGGFDTMTKHANLPEQVKAHMPAVEWFAVSAHIDGGVRGQLRAEAADDKAGENLRAVINGAIAAARLVGGKDMKLDALINSLQIGGKGKDVELAFAVSPEVIDVIAGLSANNLKQLHDTATPERHDKK